MMASETIFVRVLEEDVDCWRPVQAVNEGADRYRIVGANPDPTDERWEFSAGEIVICERRGLSGGDALVAIRRAEGT
jgi:hypothetical protein